MVIGQVGLSGMTVAKVAREAGVSQGMVNFHFDSKEALLGEVLRELVEGYDRDCERAASGLDGSPEDRLRSLMVSLLSHAEDPVRLGSWFAFWGDASARSLYEEIGGPVDRATFRRLAQLGQELLPSEAPEEAPRRMAEALVALVNGHWVMKLMRPHEVQLGDGLHAVQIYLESVSSRR